MRNLQSVQANIEEKPLTIEAGLLAQQADGAVTVRLGETVVLAAVSSSREPREGIDYFPLQVEYREKYYAAGRFPGGFFKREARPSEKEVLTARFTDRPLRPLFPQSCRCDVQVNNMLLSADGENDADILSIVGASAALVISHLPFHGPIGAVRVGRIKGEFVINPTNSQRAESDLDLVYVGTKKFPIMIEGTAQEISEEALLQAMKAAHGECVKIIDAQLELRQKLGLPEKVLSEKTQEDPALNAVRELAVNDLSNALHIPEKVQRLRKIADIGKSVREKLQEKFPEMTKESFRTAFDNLEIELVRKEVLEKGHRIDGRGFDEIRPLSATVGLLPRVHGSSLFSRGETQVIGTVTLGATSDSQSMDAITGGPEEKRFMLHYNFPPYSVGEVGRIGFTGRREIGHGALAERSLRPLIPADYPYTIRLVSDITESNGSTSMASVCAGSLALMDAGVPIRKSVAGISIGLFSSEKKTQLVVDILGDEDHCGDMDFKVAGTRDGITGFQMDLKIRGLEWNVVAQAFEKARVARRQILDFMDGIIAKPRDDLSPYAPRIRQLKINPEKIGDLIGPGGKHIRRITDITRTQIDIEDDGTVSIFSANKNDLDLAVREISVITAEAEVGVIYNGTVTGIKDFGVFVEIIPGSDGLVHISELADVRIKHPSEICRIGDQMWVKCIGVDDRGRIKLSRNQAMQEKDAAAQCPSAETTKHGTKGPSDTWIPGT